MGVYFSFLGVIFGKLLNSEPKAMFLWSLVLGFVILNTAYIIPITTSILWLDYLFIGIVTLLCGYLLGRFTDSQLYVHLLRRVKIFYTPNKYLWYDTVDKKGDTWIVIKYLDKNIAYKGVLSCYEEQQRFPQIMLTRYKVYSVDKWKEIKDCSEDNRVIMLDTSKADSIEFLYTTENGRKIR